MDRALDATHAECSTTHDNLTVGDVTITVIVTVTNDYYNVMLITILIVTVTVTVTVSPGALWLRPVDPDLRLTAQRRLITTTRTAS